jgi:hypothetical protein
VRRRRGLRYECADHDDAHLPRPTYPTYPTYPTQRAYPTHPTYPTPH